MQILSPNFGHGDKIPPQYTCDGENVSPELVFKDVPQEAKSLTLICHDPDAPKEGGWTHWIIADMSTQIGGIEEGQPPASGVECTTDFGRTGYGGPCPPSGSHRYYFYLYALDKQLNLDLSATKSDVERAMEGHVIKKAELVSIYQRN